MADVTRAEFQRNRDLEAECMMLEADPLPEARVQYEEECHPYLESLHKRSARLINDRATRQKSTACAQQQRTEGKWYVRARRFADSVRVFDNLERDIDDEKKQDSVLSQSEDGSFGGCHEQWFFKAEASLNRFFYSGENKMEPLPKWPSILDETQNGNTLLDEFNKYLDPSSGIPLYARRAALNNMTGMVAIIYRGLPYGYEFTDEMREDLRSFLDDEWQDPATGFWGVTNWEESSCAFHPHISLTFHIANYRARQPMPYPEYSKINYWPQIIDTLLSMKFDEWPEGWREDGKFSHHHAYDVVELFRYGWQDATPEQRKVMKREILDMLSYSTKRIMDENYKFDDDEVGCEDIEESLSYHVFMLESAGFFNENERFWADACEDLNLPDPTDVALRLFDEIEKYKSDSNPELKRAGTYVTRAKLQQ